MKAVKRATYGIQGDTFGERLLDAIEKSGHTRSDLAKDIRKSWNHIHLWCTDKVLPKSDSLKDIAEALGVSLNELLGLNLEEDPPLESWREFLLTEEGQGLSETERLALVHLWWPSHLGDPTVFSYQLALQAIRAMSVRETP